jgi:hypothetical protein
MQVGAVVEHTQLVVPQLVAQEALVVVVLVAP